MFARITTVKTGKGTYQYLQVLESYHHEGRCRHRLVANLGRVDLLGSKLDGLVRSLGKYCEKKLIAPDQIKCKEALIWGPVLLVRHLWDQMSLSELIHKHCTSPRQKLDVAETAFVLVANRLCEPSSEHGLARWLEHTFVCDSGGRRWEPDWLPSRRVSKQQRVKVHHRQLHQWYGTLDTLLAAKEKIEEGMYLRVRDLFSVKVDMVFYDLTSTYFCRKRPKGNLRRHGISKDGKPRQVQVILGVVMANGFPIAHHVFPGHTAEKATLQKVLTDLQNRFGLRRVMVVSDRGLVSPDNLDFLSKTQWCYLLGIAGRRCQEAAEVLEALDANQWHRVDDTNRVQEVHSAGRSGRYFVIDSEDRKVYEQSMRLRSMERAKQQLQKVAQAVSAGRLKAPAKIGSWAGRALSRHHGYRYYCWQVSGPGQFDFFEDSEKIRAEMLHEGKYILKTDDGKISSAEAVAAYKELNTVEQGFRDLKDVIDMRPIYHQNDERIEAHIFVASLALFLKRVLEHQLSSQLPPLSATDALAAMRSVGISQLDLDGQMMRLVSGGGRDARRIMRAMGITEINPPGTVETALESSRTPT